MSLTYSQLFYQLKSELETLNYEQREAAAIAHFWIEEVTGKSKLERLNLKDTSINSDVYDQYSAALRAFRKKIPVQFILGYAYFMNRKFTVNTATLIPRPETEELVDWILKDNVGKANELNILDIGTGSGCIPISLKLELPNSILSGMDINRDAIQIAKENANYWNVDVNFFELDFTEQEKWNALNHYDIIVSNPPYIPVAEHLEMDDHVVEHESHIALFVPDNDPLKFYKLIALFAVAHLNKNGAIYCEIHKDFGKEIVLLFKEMGFTHVELKQDLNGHDRMVKVCF
jgi:release factor glutamine methyltransferase